MEAFKTSMSQAGGFYMSTEDQVRAQRLPDLQPDNKEGQFRSHPTFAHTREITQDSDQDYFSASSLSSVSSDSSLAFRWKQDPMPSPHVKEDSGYGFSASSFGVQAFEEHRDRYAQLDSVRSRPRPSLRLEDDAILRSSGGSFDRSSMTYSANSSLEDSTSQKEASTLAAAPPAISGSLTPRLGDFWHGTDHPFPQSLQDARNLAQVGFPAGGHHPHDSARRMPTLPGEEPYHGTAQKHDRMLRHSYSVS